MKIIPATNKNNPLTNFLGIKMEARVRLIYFRAVLGHCRKFGSPVWAIIADPAGGFFKQLRYC